MNEGIAGGGGGGGGVFSSTAAEGKWTPRPPNTRPQRGDGSAKAGLPPTSGGYPLLGILPGLGSGIPGPTGGGRSRAGQERK